jgi:23S rRNA (cytidine1920-2'-O)/16S rRNA (cytidine1409-2'-O)-methyltransferase
MSMNSFHARSKRPQPKTEQTHKASERPPGMERADVLLVVRALVPSRTCARRLIEAGRVHVDGELVTKPGQLLSVDVKFTVEGDN